MPLLRGEEERLVGKWTGSGDEGAWTARGFN